MFRVIFWTLSSDFAVNPQKNKVLQLSVKATVLLSGGETQLENGA